MVNIIDLSIKSFPAEQILIGMLVDVQLDVMVNLFEVIDLFSLDIFLFQDRA